MSKETGGAAFPTQPNTQAGHFKQDGMTLRDYFAAKAMQGELASQQSMKDSYNSAGDLAQLSAWCYDMADAMLAERAK